MSTTRSGRSEAAAKGWMVLYQPRRPMAVGALRPARRRSRRRASLATRSR